MDKKLTLAALSALGQETRLDIFRLLVRAGPDGLAAGEIAEELGVLQNTLSANLSVLLRAGMVRNRREGRSIRYFTDMDGMAGLLAYLMEDCCGGAPSCCNPAIEEVTGCCPSG